jgi:hypothetical protein
MTPADRVSDERLAVLVRAYDFLGNATDQQDVVSALRELQRLRGGQWQPIETAPTSGIDVLVCGGTYGCEVNSHEFHNVAFRQAAVAAWESDDHCWRDTGGYYYTPTHWQPLPTPPKDKP